MPEVPDKIPESLKSSIDRRVAGIKLAVEDLLYFYAKGSLTRADAEDKIAMINVELHIGLDKIDRNS